MVSVVTATDQSPYRLSIKMSGVVQGVGMRPKIYQLATMNQLTGHVLNDEQGVTIEVQGSQSQLNAFKQSLKNNLPPQAMVKKYHEKKCGYKANETNFTILKSIKAPDAESHIGEDLAICEACLKDCFNPGSPYYLYPFINCSYCGPRYSIFKSRPYDRATTTMASFAMCEACQRQYQSPDNRRFHAEPIACQQCGPAFTSAIKSMAAQLLKGEIIAVKNLTCYQWICLTSERNIERLRQIKKRPQKPFVMMSLNLNSIHDYATVNQKESELLSSPQRPIVILNKALSKISHHIAPGLNSIGAMLPYSALHYLLFYYCLGEPQGAEWLKADCNLHFIVTSANEKSEPVIKDDANAIRLAKAQHTAIYTHNRDIHHALDDSIVKSTAVGFMSIRRARGYVPNVIPLQHDTPTTLALGAYLKNTVCIIKDKEAFLSPYIGTLNNRQTLKKHRDEINALMRYLNIKPELIAYEKCPQHPTHSLLDEYPQTKVGIYHHHAHLYGVAGEAQLMSPHLGLALDGLGYGPNQALWGGELFYFNGQSYQHLAQIQPMPLPGGDKASLEPWRMALSLSHLAHIDKTIEGIPLSQQQLIKQCINKKVHSPLTSSCGRLFDGVSALLGVCLVNTYEAEAAMKLESLVTDPVTLDNGFNIKQNQLSFIPLIQQLIGLDKTEGANLFHGTLVVALSKLIERHAKQYQCRDIVLSGGCFNNVVLAENLSQSLNQASLKAYLPHKHPANDSGLSLGQALLAPLIQGHQTCV